MIVARVLVGRMFSTSTQRKYWTFHQQAELEQLREEVNHQYVAKNGGGDTDADVSILPGLESKGKVVPYSYEHSGLELIPIVSRQSAPAVSYHYFLPGLRSENQRASPPFGQYQIILLDNRVYEQLAQSCYLVAESAGNQTHNLSVTSPMP